jgi:hypothetical protein
MTASIDESRVWDVLLYVFCASQKDSDRLAGLAEAVSGYQVTDIGSPLFLGLDEQRRRLAEFRQPPRSSPAPVLSLDWIIDQFVQNAVRRTSFLRNVSNG